MVTFVFCHISLNRWHGQRTSQKQGQQSIILVTAMSPWEIRTVAVLPTADMQQCPQTLYDCSTLEMSLTSVADVILMPDFVSSVHNDHVHVNEICRFLKTPSCSDTVLSECKGEVVYASGAVKARMQYVCGNRQSHKDMQELKGCYHKFHRHFGHCAKKHQKHREQLEWSPPASVSPNSWCNLTQEYITCVYSVMALGCALDVANHYMHTVNMSAPVVQAIRGYGCAFGHPLDILRTTSPISVVTSAPVRGPDPSIDRPAFRSAATELRCAAEIYHVVSSLAVVLFLFPQPGWRNNIVIPFMNLGFIVIVPWIQYPGPS